MKKPAEFMKYLNVIPVIICIVISFLFYDLTKTIEWNNYELRFNEKKTLISHTVAQFEELAIKYKDLKGMEAFAEERLCIFVKAIDMLDATVCLLANENLEMLQPPGSGSNAVTYNPLENPEFCETVLSTQLGTVKMPYSEGEISLYYHWLRDANGINQQLFVVGVVSSLETALDLRLQYAIAALLIFVVIANYLMIGVIRKKMAGDCIG